MNETISVLQKFQPEHFHMDPWPHIHIENALPDHMYDQLAKEYPESVLDGDIKGYRDFRYCQYQFTDRFVTPLWKKFVDFHVSKDFLHQVIRAIEPGMRRYYPDITDKYLDIGVSLRRQGKPRKTAAMEVQFVMNSPNVSDIRAPHLDQNRELFAALFYMKKPEDLSHGGDLVLYKKKQAEGFQFIKGRMAPIDAIEEQGRVPYKANSLVLFLNTIDSIHGVSARTDAQHLRRYVNIGCHIIEKLFLLDYPEDDANS